MLHSPEELRLILQRVELEPGARRVMDRLFDYSHRTARQVMTLRSDVVVLDAGRSWEENLTVAVAEQYTRYPVVEGENGRPLGYVHLKDIVAAQGVCSAFLHGGTSSILALGPDGAGRPWPVGIRNPFVARLVLKEVQASKFVAAWKI